MIKEYLLKTLKIQETRHYKNSDFYYNELLISNAFLNKNQTIFVVLPNLYDAQKYYDGLSNLLGEEKILFYPTDQILTSLMALGSPEFKNERLYTLRELLSNNSYVVVMSYEGMLRRQLKPLDYLNSEKTIKTKMVISQDDLIKTLLSNGYKREYTVENPGEFSLRGSVFDIFNNDNQFPYRLEYFDDEIEKIKQFDIDTQRSFKEVDEFNIRPLNELFYQNQIKDVVVSEIKNEFNQKQLSEKEKEKLTKDLENLENRTKLDTLNLYISYFNKEVTTIREFSNKNKAFFIDYHKMLINEERSVDDLKAFQVSLGGKSFLDIPYQQKLEKAIHEQDIFIENLNITSNKEALELKIESLNYYSSNFEMFYLDHKQYFNNYTVILSFINEANYKKMAEFLKEKNLNYNQNIIIDNQINIILDENYLNYLDHESKVLVVSESHLINAKVRPKIRYRSVLNQSTKIRHVDELKIGDYVVHYDYGIARYLGLKTMDITGQKRDYLHLLYAQEKSMYIPVDQIDLVLKYGSFDSKPPRLSNLNSNTWNKTKTDVKRKIKDLSDKLLNLYAERDISKGYSYIDFPSMEEEFANDFSYEETVDQKKAILAVNEDLKSDKPMDRLIAGDVGFGKTEIALRAAFKTVLNGKQVAYLVPTTVLARQHYYTFKERFDKYGANVVLMSRFVSNKEISENIEKIKKGLVDVVVGTHRILSKDIEFKDLGLFIIDEEQRFGVEHKERIKEMKVSVDTLTLSATPIPRTLQMSLSGLKDLSLIDTPPLNRYPVQTYILERDMALVREAISRELARGGQVFYLYNRVSSIPGMVKRLSDLVPDARIAYAHGKMNREELEDVISSFIDHDYDVLVSTTIIETGIDIPNTNTLIIHEADRLGLSQLYQIRGRVGRSDKIAYAYLMYDPSKILNDDAQKRLKAIEQYTELGSGFKIAMQDLSIRGAGDLLGSEQSGFIDSVGMELYLKLLEETITGKESMPRVEGEIFVDQYIDPEYVNDETVRIEIHKEIAKLNHIKDVEFLKESLIDRFGPLSPEIILYMYEKLYKKQAHQLGVEKTKPGPITELIISREKSALIDGEKLFTYCNQFMVPVLLSYQRQRISINFDLRKDNRHWLYIVNVFLSGYFDFLDNK